MSSPIPLPDRPSLEQLRKQAKERLVVLRAADPSVKLATVQLTIAHEYGFASWPKLVDHVAAIDAEESSPRITSPVSRYLGAVDLARTVAFWRDVLGFVAADAADDGSVELTSGRARIRFGTRDQQAGFSDAGRPPGSAVVFFDTDDVEAMRAAIAGRGGQPTAPENVNGIKRRVFEVRDPDGHAIWFGQSYHRDSPYRPPRMMRKIMPELPSDDVSTAVRHYRDVLGFSVNYEQHDIGVLDRDDVRLLVIARTPRHTGIGSACFYVRDADALHGELVRNGADVQGAPVSQPWGLREFAVLDPDGNRLTFAQTFE